MWGLCPVSGLICEWLPLHLPLGRVIMQGEALYQMPGSCHTHAIGLSGLWNYELNTTLFFIKSRSQAFCHSNRKLTKTQGVVCPSHNCPGGGFGI